MEESLTWKAYVVLGVLAVTLILSLWRRTLHRDSLFFVGAVLTAIAGVVPAKELFSAFVNGAVLILFLQQLFSRLLLPTNKWKGLFPAALLAPFAAHERLLLAFRGRYFPLAFLIAIAGIATPIGSPINLAIYELSGYSLSWTALASIGIPLILIALIYLSLIKVSASAHPPGDAIVPLGSIWIFQGKKEGEIVELDSSNPSTPDLLLLRKRKGGFWEGFRWHPFLLLVSALIFAAAIKESGIDRYINALAAPFFHSSPILYEIELFLLIFALSHLIPNVITAALFLPFASTPILPIIAATCAFLTPKSSDVNLLAKGLSGRRLQDFLKFGAPLSLACLLMELLWN